MITYLNEVGPDTIHYHFIYLFRGSMSRANLVRLCEGSFAMRGRGGPRKLVVPGFRQFHFGTATGYPIIKYNDI